MTGNFLKVVTCLLFITTTAFSSQIITGSAGVLLTGPVTDEQKQTGRNSARMELKKNILSWLKEEQGITIDSLNDLDNFAVNQYIDSCIRFTKEEAAFNGNILNITFLLSYESAEEALRNHNKATDARATESWEMFKKAETENDYQNCIFEGIRTIAAANAHFGPPLIIPNSESKPLIDVARSAVQALYNRMKVTSSDMIIDGNPGNIVSKPPSLTTVIDSTPLSGIWFTAKLQNGKELFSKISNEEGKISLSDFRIPFVTKGTLMYIHIDPGKIIGSPTLIKSELFGLKLKNSQDQTFIIKIERPLYTLDCKANSVGNISMPADFANVSIVKNFLRDSCYMQEASNGSTANLDIIINAQVSDYNYDETEEIGIKTSIRISVKGQDYKPPINSEKTILFEKKYERSTKVPYGLYFWEANIKLRELIRTTISEL